MKGFSNGIGRLERTSSPTVSLMTATFGEVSVSRIVKPRPAMTGIPNVEKKCSPTELNATC